MKKFILFGVLAFSLTSLTSCMKEYTCTCPPGSSATVKTINKAEARQECVAVGCSL